MPSGGASWRGSGGGGGVRGGGGGGRGGGGGWVGGGGDFPVQGGDGLVLGGGADRRVRQQPGQLSFGAGQGFLRLAHRGGGGLAGRVADDLGVRLDAGEVVADLVYPVVLAGVLQEVLLPPPGFQPGQ